MINFFGPQPNPNALSSDDLLISAAFDTSHAVFTGRVMTLSTETDPETDRALSIVQFELSRVWKGTIPEVAQVASLPQNSSCHFPFMEGQRYLVYAHADESGRLRTNLCSRTKLLVQAEDAAELEELDRLAARAPKSHRLYPHILQADRRLAKLRYEVLKAGQVTLRVFDARGRQIETCVDAHQAEGCYQIDLRMDAWPVGLYLYELHVGHQVSSQLMLLPGERVEVPALVNRHSLYAAAV